ncbi:hypothetical protein GGR52DRAFT_561806 [Hypoxylon sp. FL1284]|nr:hypothetical protein GGR52DRAFT_561806 [Hypoxylon sp. FL1284]
MTARFHVFGSILNLVQPRTRISITSSSCILSDSHYHRQSFPLPPNMDANLQYVEDLDLTESERPMFNVLKATLQYPAKAEAKSTKLAHDFNFFYETSEEGIESLWEIWFLILDIATCVPPGHEWQDSLLKSLDMVRRQEQPIHELTGCDEG